MQIAIKCSYCGKSFECKEWNLDRTIAECSKHEEECEKSRIDTIKSRYNFGIAKCCATCQHCKKTGNEMLCKQLVIPADGEEKNYYCDISEVNICDLYEAKEKVGEAKGNLDEDSDENVKIAKNSPQSVFVLTSHDFCNHYFRILGVYSEYKNAVKAYDLYEEDLDKTPLEENDEYSIIEIDFNSLNSPQYGAKFIDEDCEEKL